MIRIPPLSPPLPSPLPHRTPLPLCLQSPPPVPPPPDSGSFLPSLLPHYHADPHLSLTQSLMVVSWLWLSLLLATLLRSTRRSLTFACCDRRTRRVIRERKRNRATRRAAASSNAASASASSSASAASSRPAATTALLSTSQSSYAALSDAECGRLLPPAASSDRVDARDDEPKPEYSDDEEEIDLLRSTVDLPLADQTQQAKDGWKRSLQQPLSSWIDDSQSASAAWGDVFPLFANRGALVWTALVSLLLLAGCIDLPPFSRKLHLMALGLSVTLPTLAPGVAFPVALLPLPPPFIVFLSAEADKPIARACSRRVVQRHKRPAPSPYSLNA